MYENEQMWSFYCEINQRFWGFDFQAASEWAIIGTHFTGEALPLHTRLVWRVCRGILQRPGFVILQGNLRAAAWVVTPNYSVVTHNEKTFTTLWHKLIETEYETLVRHSWVNVRIWWLYLAVNWFFFFFHQTKLCIFLFFFS